METQWTWRARERRESETTYSWEDWVHVGHTGEGAQWVPVGREADFWCVHITPGGPLPFQVEKCKRKLPTKVWISGEV